GGSCGGGTPPSNESKRKRFASLSAGVGLEGSSKKSRMGSYSTPPSSIIKLP
ncbi:UNVERIFIED_CONTAM: hypothetical protein Sradi_4894100, partial [Sesamum radiatum]